MTHSPQSIPAQQLIEAGPFRANGRAQITVETDALDLARITVQSGEFTTTIMLAGDHLEAMAKALNAARAARRRALKAAA
jgi:prolyl-tRNA editing enzyme YbaK/EbsC (Cys-tRNA(Pro) deacylase)